MATIQELESALVKADAAGNAEDARALTRAIDQMRASPTPAAPTAQQGATKPAAPRRDFAGDLSRISQSARPPGSNIPSGDYGRRTPRTRDAAVAAQGEQMDQAGTVLKFAPAVAAGIATGGASIPLQMAATGLAGVAGSSLEQATRPGDEAFSTREALATGIETSIPMVRLAPITPFMSTAKAAGLAGARAVVSGTLAGGLSEAATAVRDGGEGGTYVPPKNAKETLTRLFSPSAAVAAAFSVAGSAGERVAGRGALGQQVAAQRGATTQTSSAAPATTIMLTDVLPQYAPLEARSIIAKNPRALEQLRDLTVDVDQTILDTFAGAPNSAQLVSELAPNVGKLKAIKQSAQAAEAAKAQAQEAYQQAVATGRADVRKFRVDAESAALEASKQKLLVQSGIDQLFPQGTPALAALAPAKNTAELAGLIEDTFKVQKEALGSLYEQAGIGVNDAVIDKAGLVRAINRKAGDTKSMLAGNEARRAALEQVDQLFSGAPTLTLEQFRNARNAIADGLGDNRLFASSAQKLAGETYDVFRDSSNKFIASNRADSFPAWQKANETAAGIFKARDSAFIQDFVDPNTGALRQGKAGEFVKAITDGKFEGFSDLEKLGASIAATGDPAALAAADQFGKGVARYVATGILDSAVVNRGLGVASDAAVFDPKKLYTTLNKMQSAGFPVEKIGMGTPRDINALSRIAEGTSLTKAELDDFFKNVTTLGGDAAAARMAYRRQVVSNILNLGGGSRVERIRKTQALARRAKLDANAAQAELAAAQADPLVVAFGEGNFGVSADATAPNMDAWLSSARTIAPNQLAKLVSAMPAAKAAQFRAATAADVFTRYSNVVPGVTPSADIRGITDLFTSPSPAAAQERAALRAIMGNQEFDKMAKIGKQIEPILRTRYALQRASLESAGNTGELVGGAGALAGLTSGNFQTGFVVGRSVGAIRRLVDRGQYNLLYQLYINPNLAPKFARAGYNIEKFANESGLHRVAIQIAEREDEERNAAASAE